MECCVTKNGQADYRWQPVNLWNSLRDIIKNRLNIQAINAITNGADLGDAVAAVLNLEPS